MFDLAVDDRILDSSPARRITMPKRIRKVDDTYADQDVVRKLFQAAGKRDRLILRIFVSCGLRPQETFALRGNDIETGRPRVSERLGHSSVYVTTTVYSHRIKGRDEEAARKWEKFQKKNGGGPAGPKRV
jgi:integrase